MFDLSRFTVSVSWRNSLPFIYTNAYRPPRPSTQAQPTVLPGSAGDRNSPLKTSRVLRVQPYS